MRTRRGRMVNMACSAISVVKTHADAATVVTRCTTITRMSVPTPLP